MVLWRSENDAQGANDGIMRHLFQPLYHISSEGQELIGYEALVRFDGIDTSAGLAVLRSRGIDALRAFDCASATSAIASARQWLMPGVALFLNLTHATVGHVIDDGSLPESDNPIVWELLEDPETTALLTRPGVLDGLASRFTLALDDVGAGCADLQRLAAAVHAGVTWIKADKSIVQGCAQDKGKVAVLRAIAGLGVRVIAEGVEDEADLDVIRAAGIAYAQGFVLGRPDESPLITQERLLARV